MSTKLVNDTLQSLSSTLPGHYVRMLSDDPTVYIRVLGFRVHGRAKVLGFGVGISVLAGFRLAV